MSTRQFDLLQEALESLDAGESVEAILSRHPHALQELEPLLRAALQAAQREIVDPSGDAIHRSRARMLAHAAELRSSTQRRTLFTPLPRFATAAIALALILIISGYGLFSASAQALPGDLLYPVKRSAENIRLGVASDAETRASLEKQFEQRRTDEVVRLLAEGRLQQISFEGNVERINGQDWVVSGIQVLLGDGTRVIGDIQLNDEIEVEGETRAEGFVYAHELHKHLMRLQGIVDRLTSDIISIDGNLFDISEASDLDDEIGVGDLVEARASIGDDQSLTLLEVRLIESDEQQEDEPDAEEPGRIDDDAEDREAEDLPEDDVDESPETSDQSELDSDDGDNEPEDDETREEEHEDEVDPDEEEEEEELDD